MTSTEPHQPRKRFGQHFLHDKAVIQRIVDYINPQPADHLLEIGPGQGALTEALLARVSPIHAVELDRDLATMLKAQFSPEQLRLHITDALKFDFCSVAEDDTKIRLVGNLPYNISTPLIFHALEQVHCIQDMCFMLQKEVVQRLCAKPGTKDYGRLSVMIQYRCQIQKWFNVGAGAFKPAPRVTSAVVHLLPHATLPVTVKDDQCLQRVVQAAFGQRRKTLRNGLKGLLTEEQIRKLGIDPSQRAETLDIGAFAALSNAVTDNKTFK